MLIKKLIHKKMKVEHKYKYPYTTQTVKSPSFKRLGGIKGDSEWPNAIYDDDGCTFDLHYS